MIVHKISSIVQMTALTSIVTLNGGSSGTFRGITPQNCGNNTNAASCLKSLGLDVCGTGKYYQEGECISSCGASFKLNDGECDRIRYTPAEAAQVLRDDNTNEVTITFKK